MEVIKKQILLSISKILKKKNANQELTVPNDDIVQLCSNTENNIEKSLMIFFTLIESEVELLLQSETQLCFVGLFDWSVQNHKYGY